MSAEERHREREQQLEQARKIVMEQLINVKDAFDEAPSFPTIVKEMLVFVEFTELLHLSTIMSAFGTCMGNAMQAEVEGNHEVKQELVLLAKKLLSTCEEDFRRGMEFRSKQTLDHIGATKLYEAEDALTTNERTFREVMEELRREEGANDPGESTPEK